MKTVQVVFILALLCQVLVAHAADKGRDSWPVQKDQPATTYEKVKHTTEEVVVHANNHGNEERKHKVVEQEYKKNENHHDDGKWQSRSNENKKDTHDNGKWQSRSNGHEEQSRSYDGKREKNYSDENRRYDTRRGENDGYSRTTERIQYQENRNSRGTGNTNPDRYRAFDIVRRNDGRNNEEGVYRAGRPDRQQIIDRDDRLSSRTLAAAAAPRTIPQADDFSISRPRAVSTLVSEGQVRNFANANGITFPTTPLFTPAGRDGDFPASRDPLVYATAPNSLFQTQINVQSQDNEFNVPNKETDRRSSAFSPVAVDPVDLADGIGWNENEEARAFNSNGLARTGIRNTAFANERSRRPAAGTIRTSAINGRTAGSRLRDGDLLPVTRSGLINVRGEELRERDRDGLIRTVTRTITNDNRRLADNLDIAPFTRRTSELRERSNLREDDLQLAGRSGLVNVREEEIQERDPGGVTRTVTRIRTTTDNGRRPASALDLDPDSRRSSSTLRRSGTPDDALSRASRTRSGLRSEFVDDFVPTDQLLNNSGLSRASSGQTKSNQQGINIINGDLESDAANRALRPQSGGGTIGNGVRNRQDVNVLNGNIVRTSRPDRVFDNLRFASASNFEFLPKKERPF